MGDARVGSTTGSRQRTKVEVGAIVPDIIGSRVGRLLLFAPASAARGTYEGVESRSNAFEGSMSGIRTVSGQRGL